MNKWIKEEYCHSFSGGQKFMINQSAWLYQYGFKHRQPTNSAMQRGLTSEFITYYVMKRENQFKEHKPIEDITDWHFKRNLFAYDVDEVQNSIAISKQFKKALQERQLTKINDYQKKIVVDGKKYGLEYPIVCYTDFEFDDRIVDTKATLKCPTNPKTSHIRQQCLYSKLYDKPTSPCNISTKLNLFGVAYKIEVGLYSKLYDKPTSILYATPKRFNFVDILQGEVEQGFQECIDTFKNIENYLKVCDTLEKAVMITPLNTDDYYFSNNMKQEARKQWQKIINKM